MAPPSAHRRRSTATAARRRSSAPTPTTASNSRQRRVSGSSAGGVAARSRRDRELGPQLHEVSAVAEDSRQRGVRTSDQPRVERLDDRLVGRSQTLVAASVEHGEATRCGVGRDGGSQPRLANAGFADDEHRPCAACGDRLQHRARLRQLGAPPDQRERLPPRQARPATTPSPAPSRDQLVDLDGDSKPRRTRSPTNRSGCEERPRHRRTVASATSTDPPGASAHKRPASIAAAPSQSAPSRTMSPVLTPMRRHSSSPPIASRRATPATQRPHPGRQRRS